MIKISEDTRKAYKEIYRIIQHSSKEIQMKIPQKFISVIKATMSQEYEPNINYNKDINEQSLMPETFSLMSLIYRDFICMPDKRKELLNEEKRLLQEIEEEKRILYNPENIFKNKGQDEIKPGNIIEYKVSFFQRVINKIRERFKRHRK